MLGKKKTHARRFKIENKIPKVIFRNFIHFCGDEQTMEITNEQPK